VLSWNVDAPDSKRLVYVNDWDPVLGPQALWDVFMQRLGSRRGEYAVITTALTSTTHQGWIDAMVAYQKAKYPTMKKVDEQENGGDQTVADQKAKAIIQAHPNLIGIVSVDAGGTVGIAQATQELNITDKVFTTGLSTPSQMRQFVKSGVVPKFVLWDPALACYLATVIGFKLLNGQSVKSGDTLHVSTKTVRNIQIKRIPRHGNSPQAFAGNAIVFDKSNVDKYKF
jgi:ABC-type sugar transport system substrate-binding protein